MASDPIQGISMPEHSGVQADDNLQLPTGRSSSRDLAAFSVSHQKAPLQENGAVCALSVGSSGFNVQRS